MGDRVSISFKDEDEDSVCLFHHWGGVEFPKYAFDWFKGLKEKTGKTKNSNPITRFEPRSMLAQFICHIAQTPGFKECMGFIGLRAVFKNILTHRISCKDYFIFWEKLIHFFIGYADS